MGATDCSTAGNDTEDLVSVSARALGVNTINKISVSLNTLKVLPTDEGLPRDWRGLAQLTGLDGNLTRSLGCKPDPTAEVLKLWINNKASEASIGSLKSYLSQMDRWDIIDDTSSMIEQDTKEFTTRLKNVDMSERHLAVEADKHILTVDDVCRLENGLQPQNYDAFLLFAEEDVDFAMQIVGKMEDDYGLKLCIKDRDLVGGLTFEHEAIMKLIAERCNRLIVVVSPNFLKSEANKFFVTFAQALGIEQRQRKVVPCLYQPCQLPPELSYYFLLDFNRAGKLWNIWEKLRDSIQAPPLKSDSRIPLYETRSWATQARTPNMNSASTENSQKSLSPLQQREPPPPYSPSDMTQGAVHNSDGGIFSSAPEYCSSSNAVPVGWNKISQSTSESNLITQLHLNGNNLINEVHGSESDVCHQLEVGKEKGKPFRWLRKLLPREGKRKRHKKKAVCN
ncbi:myeloid differentiation primary response protein MyD88 [Hetaerina americana]|uniref:myeloid differentiation primary response protein MyD88 n=1 Tax=Hetaerina americana TaxID=62018 RepID=UPI003A7F291E